MSVELRVCVARPFDKAEGFCRQTEQFKVVDREAKTFLNALSHGNLRSNSL